MSWYFLIGFLMKKTHKETVVGYRFCTYLVREPQQGQIQTLLPCLVKAPRSPLGSLGIPRDPYGPNWWTPTEEKLPYQTLLDAQEVLGPPRIS